VSLDALVLLGCRVELGALPGAAERRVVRAARAFEEGLAPRIVVSGGRVWGDARESETLGRALEARGVPQAAILLESASQNTLENARFSARLLFPSGLRRVGVVSCDWHLPRALWVFRRAGFEPFAVPAPSPAIPFGERSVRSLREHGAWLLGRVAAIGW
jgi:uncharacterized SAM-binding protein YcdF (DUF218 family)